MVKSIRDDAASHAAANAEKVAAPVMGEISASRDGRDITYGYLGKIRQHQDSVLAMRGGGLEIYEDVLRDPQVFSCFQQRRLAVTSKEWDVEAGAEDKQSQMAAEFLREQLSDVGFDNAMGKMLHGLFYGYAVAECMWGKDGRHFTLDTIKVRKARRFRYDDEGGLRLLTQIDAVEGELMEPRKFWTFNAGADNDDEPYGLGLGHWCYWPVWFKKNGLKFWAMYLDKFGMPTGVGKYPAGTTAEDQRKLLNAVAAIQSDSGIIIPDGMMIDLLEATRAGTSDNKSFHDTMDAAIAKVILSQTMTTDNGSSRSQGEVHEDVKEEVIKADADLICSSFNNQVALWLTEWNFPNAVPPRVWRDIEPPEDLDARAERDTKIYNLGYEPTEDYIKETYGEGFVKKQPVEPPAVLPGLPGGPPLKGKALAPVDPAKAAAEAELAFAEAKARTDDPVTRLADQALIVGNAPLAQLVDDIRDLIDKSVDLAEFQASLLEAYPKIDVSNVAALIRDALIVAELNGHDDFDKDATGKRA